MPYKDKQKQKEAQQRHYLENKNKYINSRKTNRDLRDVWFVDLKSKLNCSMCEEVDCRCLDFHHRDSTTKEFTIADAVKDGYCEDRILAEIAKCDVVCANCHRRIHFAKGFKRHSRSRIAIKRDWLNDYKKTLCCVACGLKDWVVLDFHHKDGVEKRRSVCDMITNGTSLLSIIKEIDKCDPICANCHRKEHNGNKWTSSTS